jgi:hypothetical protein
MGLAVASAQINRTWTGAVNSDWYNANNWAPAGVPTTNDIVNLTNGTINLTAPVTIYGQLNWSGGILSGAALTIASNAVMNINATTTLFLENPLTNAGTVTWSNACALDVLNNNGSPYASLIENLAGALWDIQNDQSMFNNAGTLAYFRNAGTLRKSGQSGATYIQIPVYNSGSITGLQGTLNLGGGGNVAGSYAASAGAVVAFYAGYFTNTVPAGIFGPGTVALTTSGNLTLLSDAIPNLALAGGTVFLGPSFQGGSITNLTISGAALAGSNAVSGAFNWNNGTILGPLTVAGNARMTISGTTTLPLQGPLTNAGTVVWTNSGDIDVLNNNGGGYAGLIENLAGALWDIQSDRQLYNNAGTTAFFRNAGMLRKSGLASTSYIEIPFYNSGSVTGLQGTLNFSGGGTLAGTFSAAAGAAIGFTGGNFTNSGPVAINGPGLIQMAGSADLFLLSDAIPNLPLAGGTVFLGPSFQGGTITNLTINGATLTGTNTVSGTLNWNNGTVLGPLTVASSGRLNLNGTTTLLLEAPLTNAGTVIWTNSCDIDVLNNNGGGYGGLIENQAGGLWDIQSDHQMYNNAGTTAYFRNAGTLRKSAQAGSSYIVIPLYNSGSVTGLQGTLDFGGGGTLAGNFTAGLGATLNFYGGYFTNSVPVGIYGPGTVEFSGSSYLTLLSDAIPNLALAGGTVYLGPAFQAGTITNLTIAGATLAGTNTVTGVFNLNNGAIDGPLTVATNGILNIAPTTTLYFYGPLTNAGTVTWTNTGTIDVANGGAHTGLIENLAGGLWDIQSDAVMFDNFGGQAYFHNLGNLRKSSRTGITYISIAVTNEGTITALHGNINFGAGINLNGGTLMFGLSSPSSYGIMSIYGAANLGGTAGVLWLNGFVPSYGNSFNVLTYGSYTGAFTNYILPPAALWQTTYGAGTFTFSVTSINKLAFTTQPASGKLITQILAPVVVQVEDPGGNPLPTNGVPITVNLNSGLGVLSGTLTQSTDASGKASFADLSINIIGAKSLRATSPGLTATVSAGFQIVPLIGETLSGSGLLLQLNGTNSLGTTTISASTNLVTWVPIYTNPPTNGVIQFLDTSATNYRSRFYKVVQQ